MNNLPLYPTDVTEFTCECAVDYEKQYQSYASRGITDAYCGKLRELAIAAEWAHRIVTRAAALPKDRDGGTSLFELMAAFHDVVEASRAYVAWLDSLKGGQNAQ